MFLNFSEKDWLAKKLFLNKSERAIVVNKSFIQNIWYHNHTYIDKLLNVTLNTAVLIKIFKLFCMNKNDPKILCNRDKKFLNWCQIYIKCGGFRILNGYEMV